jgi:hypothetical protein
MASHCKCRLPPKTGKRVRELPIRIRELARNNQIAHCFCVVRRPRAGLAHVATVRSVPAIPDYYTRRVINQFCAAHAFDPPAY